VIWIYLTTVLFTFVAVLSIILFNWTGSDWEILWGITGFIAVVAALGFGILSIILPVAYHYDTVTCHKFAGASGRQTKMVRYNAFDWDCLTPNKSGKWIPTSGLRQFGDE